MEASIHESSEVTDYELAKLHELVLGKHSILIKEPEFIESGKADPDANWIFERRNIDLKLEETSYFLHALRQQIRLKPEEDEKVTMTDKNNAWIEERETKEALRILDDLDKELMNDKDWKDEVKKEWKNQLNTNYYPDDNEINELNKSPEFKPDLRQQVLSNNNNNINIIINNNNNNNNSNNNTTTGNNNNKNVNEDRHKAQILNNVNLLNSESAPQKIADFTIKDRQYVLNHYEQLQNWLVQLKHYYIYMEDKMEPNYVALLATAKRLSHKLKEGRVMAWLIARSESTPSKYRISLGSWFLANLPIVQGKAKVRARLRNHKNIVLKRQGILREGMQKYFKKTDDKR